VVTSEARKHTKHKVTGYPLVSLRDIVSKFIAIVLNRMQLLNAHVIVLPYDSQQQDMPPLACAADCPNNVGDL